MTESSKKPSFFVHDQVWARELEFAVENYTEDLLNRVFEGEDEEITDTESGEPFCGCNRCFWRETLVFLVPRLLEGHVKGKIVIK